MKKLVYILLIFVSYTTSVRATVQEDYLAANKLYTEGNYTDAIEIYESLISNDNLSTNIYYNLANAYYKTNDIPSAILNYERSLKLKPDHEDALFNLKMANLKTTDKIERLPELFIGNTWKNLVRSKTVDGWSKYSVILIFVALFFFISYLLSQQTIIKKTGFYAGIFFLMLSILSWTMAGQHHSLVNESAEAIIFSPSVTIKSEPNETSEKLFTLHEGTKLKLLEEVNGWSKIKLPNGNVGWILSEKIVVI